MKSYGPNCYEGKWIQSKAVKGYVIDTNGYLTSDMIRLALCPWYHCAFGWVGSVMVVSVMPRDVQFLDQEEAALFTLSNLGK
jgi:hypothetical protein